MRLGFGTEQPGNAASALDATPAEREAACAAEVASLCNTNGRPAR